MERGSFGEILGVMLRNHGGSVGGCCAVWSRVCMDGPFCSTLLSRYRTTRIGAEGNLIYDPFCCFAPLASRTIEVLTEWWRLGRLRYGLCI